MREVGEWENQKKHVDPSVEAMQASSTDASIMAKQLTANNHRAEVSVTEF